MACKVLDGPSNSPTGGSDVSSQGVQCFLGLTSLFQFPVASLQLLATLDSLGYPSASVVKNPPAKVGDARHVGSIPVSGRSREGGNINPLQYTCLENSMDRGAWQATVHGITESDMTAQFTI